MIKLIKIGDLIHQNFEEKSFDEQGNEIWNIITDVEELRKITIDTVNWWVGNNVKKVTGDFTKLSAANSKGIVLLAKIINSLNPDTTNLTQLEQEAWQKMLTFAKSGYADSQLLNNSLQAVQKYVVKGGELIQEALQAQTIEKLIAILNKL